MKVAMPVWNERISPLFDVCQTICVAEIDAGRIIEITEAALCQGEPAGKALQLHEMGVSVLICGAISRPVQRMVSAHNIQVIPFISGPGPEVIQAWLRGTLNDTSYSMPGCCGRRKRYHTVKESDIDRSKI